MSMFPNLPRKVFFQLGDISPEINMLFILQSVGDLPIEAMTEMIWEILSKHQIKNEAATQTVTVPYGGYTQTYMLVWETIERAYIEIADTVRSLKNLEGVYIAPGLDSVRILEVAGLALYSFPKISSVQSDEPKMITFSGQTIAQTEFTRICWRIEAHWLVRDLVNLPPNLKNPERLQAIIQTLPWKNTQVKVLELVELERQGFGLLLWVGAGSDISPRVMTFERRGSTPGYKRALVGKGVTFDAGGVQIKPDTCMHDMKMDMAGAATVVGAFWYADGICDIQDGFVGAIGLVENMLWGSAFKPLDILTSHSGKTVEVHHTDAEGRLVLGDLVSYVWAEYTPKSIVTFATLTGACMSALGYNYAGLMSKSESLTTEITTLATRDQEQVWRLPLDDHMIEATKATYADLKNHTKSYMAGASLGAAFIQNFVPENTQFAHLDIAGPAYLPNARGVYPENATWFGTNIAIWLLGLN